MSWWAWLLLGSLLGVAAGALIVYALFILAFATDSTTGSR